MATLTSVSLSCAPPAPNVAPASGSGEPPATTETNPALALLEPTPLTNPVLVTVDGHPITYDDVAAQVAVYALLSERTIAESVGENWYTRESVVRDFTQRAAELALLPEAEGAEPDETLLAAWRALDDATREGYAPLDDARVAAVGREPALREAWVAARLAQIDEAELWRAWVQATETLALDVIMVDNHAPADRVAQILRDEHEVERFYRTHGGEFSLPPRAEVSIIRRRVEPAQRSEDHPDRLLLQALRARIEAGESFRALATEHSQDASAERGGAYGIIHPNQFPGALQLDEGALSEVGEDDAGYYLLKVERRLRAERMPLDDGLRRRIAHRLARERYMSVATQDIVAAIEQAWASDDDEQLAALLDEHDLRQDRTAPFPYPRAGSIQHVGWSPELGDAVFEQLTEPGQMLHQLTHRGVAVVRLVARTAADRDAFQRAREGFEPAYRTYVESTAWSEYVSSFDPVDWDIDVSAAERVGARRAAAAN